MWNDIVNLKRTWDNQLKAMQGPELGQQLALDLALELVLRIRKLVHELSEDERAE
jgi:hypothetical protein